MIHPTAIVSDSARLADDVEVGPYAVIESDVEIGAGSSVGAHAVIKGPTTIGQNNRIYQFASIGDDPQDKKYAGELTRLEIGDHNTFREFCTINRGTVQDTGVTKIGDHNWLMAYAHVAHDCQIGSHCILANNATLAGHVTVGDYVIFGGFSGVHQYCAIGAHSFMAMFSAIGKDVPAYMIIAGNPAQARGINSEGLKRRGFDTGQIRTLRDAYKLIYRSGTPLDQAIATLEPRAADASELQVLVRSLKSSSRGIVR